MNWPYSFSVGDLMRRANAQAARHRKDEMAALQGLNERKRAQPKKPRLAKRSSKTVCVYCGGPVRENKTACWLHDDLDVEW